MINKIHARLHRPEKGWDPVPAAHAASYGADEWRMVDNRLLDELEARLGTFRGKTVLDLGAGPGQYSVALAKRGALVTWHDISTTYLQMARAKATEHGVADNMRFSLGYLDEAPKLLSDRFDFVFNRICWNYGLDDASFAHTVYEMVRPGGHGYVDTTHSDFQRHALSRGARLRTWINDRTGLKIGHPFPPHGRLAQLFLRQPVKHLSIDYSAPLNDRVFFEKPGTRP